METDLHIDSGLLEGIRNDQADSFEDLFNRHWQDLFNKAYRRLRDQSEAEDMVQDIFATIWSRRHTIEINSSFQGYLHNALKYKIIKWVERKNLHEEASSYLLSRMEQIESTVFDVMAASDVKKSLDEAIQSFPENMRKIFLLRAESYSIREIAEALGIAEQTVKNNNSEALRRLKLMISAKHPDLNQSFFVVLTLLILN